MSLKLPPDICASDDRSFAAYTLRHRLPHILRQIIEDGDYETEAVGQLDALGTEILEGTITPLPDADGITSAIWTKCLQPHLGKSWFAAPFLFVEMYFYRRIIDIINYRNAADSASRDPFIIKKRKGFDDAQPRTQQLAKWLATVPEMTNTLEALQELMLVNLWSNCADLSQLPETFRPAQGSSRGSQKLLIDDVARVAEYCVGKSPSLQQVDIILDNTGIELISDLALADFFISTNLVQRVVLHAKDYPIFVSDATSHDIRFTIRKLATSDTTAVAQWGQRLEKWLGSDTRCAQASQRLTIQHHPFWTLPLCFDAMLPDLRTDMNQSDLWIIKGDANYRRVVGDRHWPLDTPINTITQYLSTPCLALRVLKCELLVGMDIAKLNTFDLGNDWMTNGTYGIIQFVQ